MTRRYLLHLLILATVLLAVLLAAPARADGPDRAEVREYVVERAAYHGVSARLALAIAECESHLDPGARNPRSTATGIFQWVNPGVWYSTPYWTELGISIWAEYANGNPGAWTADVDAGVWALAHGFRSHWAC